MSRVTHVPADQREKAWICNHCSTLNEGWRLSCDGCRKQSGDPRRVPYARKPAASEGREL